MGLFNFWRKKDKAPPSTSVDKHPMSSGETWDDSAREELREALRNIILGEIRLNRSDSAAILETCREAYIEDQAPANEWEEWLNFASTQIEASSTSHAQEQTLWPEETDCDRLDLVEDDLRQHGILLWQVSPCCNTCSDAELPDRIDVIEQRHPGFRENVRGYAYYIDQNLPDMLAESEQVLLYLAYGWFPPEGTEVDDHIYETHAVGIGHEIQAALKARGFNVEWNGELSKKIGVSLNWQRRTCVI